MTFESQSLKYERIIFRLELVRAGLLAVLVGVVCLWLMSA